MPMMAYPQFKVVPDKTLQLSSPGIGGLNLKDLEFEQEVSQTPYMLNMMYRNGSFSKRYGQKVLYENDETIEQTEDEESNNIYSAVCYDGAIFFHKGKHLYRWRKADGAPVDVSGTSVFSDADDGLFINYAQKLYFMIGSKDVEGTVNDIPGGFFEYKKFVNEQSEEYWAFAEVDYYAPKVLINCRPDGEGGADRSEDYNILSDRFRFVYNGTENTTDYIVSSYENLSVEEDGYSGSIDWARTGGLVDMKILVDYDEWLQVENGENTWREDVEERLKNKQYKVEETNNTKKVVFKTAPGDGVSNVVMEFKVKDIDGENPFKTRREQIFNSKVYETFGGANNSRLFLAGCGGSMYYFSESFDISFFSESNYATLGNTEEDITCFGKQYNVLIAFKPREVYSIYSYTHTSATTPIERFVGKETFKSQLVNSKIGCDAPHSIQLVNNLLTWFNSNEGICTLVSTNIQDERNVRIISRNIERTNNFGVMGILDLDDDPLTVQSVDYNNRYFLVFPKRGFCFMWDYEISPYRFSTSGGETDPRTLSWFLFDHFYVKQFVRFGKQLMYVCADKYYDENSEADDKMVDNPFSNKLVEMDNSFRDLDFDQDNSEDAIHAYYMTPFLQFGSVEMLKNVRNIYVQTRGDTASVIEMYYYTEDSIRPRTENEEIRIGGKVWRKFAWDNFAWYSINWASTFRRKCNLKKIQMASFYFKNDEPGRDMSITHISLQYQLVKYVR